MSMNDHTKNFILPLSENYLKFVSRTVIEYIIHLAYRTQLFGKIDHYLYY